MENFHFGGPLKNTKAPSKIRKISLHDVTPDKLRTPVDMRKALHLAHKFAADKHRHQQLVTSLDLPLFYPVSFLINSEAHHADHCPNEQRHSRPSCGSRQVGSFRPHGARLESTGHPGPCMAHATRRGIRLEWFAARTRRGPTSLFGCHQSVGVPLSFPRDTSHFGTRRSTGRYTHPRWIVTRQQRFPGCFVFGCQGTSLRDSQGMN